jgi:hypothetical protein
MVATERLSTTKTSINELVGIETQECDRLSSLIK